MCHGTSQIWNFQNYTLDWQRKGHLLFYHNVGGNCFRKENASFLTCMALASPKTLRLKDLVNFVSISSWWATWNMASLKILGKKVLKSQNSEDEEDADEVVGCSSGIFVDHLYISQPRWQRNIVVLLLQQCVKGCEQRQNLEWGWEQRWRRETDERMRMTLDIGRGQSLLMLGNVKSSFWQKQNVYSSLVWRSVRPKKL